MWPVSITQPLKSVMRGHVTTHRFELGQPSFADLLIRFAIEDVVLFFLAAPVLNI